MKRAMLMLFVVVVVVAGFGAYADTRLYRRITELECYIGQQFAYADTLMKQCDGDPGLAWTKVAADAHAARTIMAAWISKRPWRDEVVSNARAANYNLAYCRFLHAQLDSLGGL